MSVVSSRYSYVLINLFTVDIFLFTWSINLYLHLARSLERSVATKPARMSKLFWLISCLMAVGFYAELWWVCNEYEYCFATELSASTTLIYVAGSARGQDEVNPVFWLAHQAGRRSHLACSGLLALIPRAWSLLTKFVIFGQWRQGSRKVTEHTQNKGDIKWVSWVYCATKSNFLFQSSKINKSFLIRLQQNLLAL